ncbi:GMC oxidoreductase [Micromonospora sp. NPDC049081]|uniref:GMC oxidoreductase n=1 Tax=Micromonospora sp. NPDC049081 TaxID=3155150 RepID=UPI0033CFD136
MSESTDVADVVIVGSGLTGAVYARLVADTVPAVRILIVEAGPAVTEPPGRHLSHVTDPGELDRAQVASQGPLRVRHGTTVASGIAHNVPRGQRDGAFLSRPGLFPVDPGGSLPAAQAACNVGGMATQWFAACPRPGGAERIDFLDPAVLDGALGVAERLLRVSARQFADSPVESRIRRRLGAALDDGRAAHRRVQPLPMALTVENGSVRRAGVDVVLGGLLGDRRRHVVLRTRTLCSRVLTDDGGVTGVELRDLATGSVSTVRTGHVVVAADSLRTPQLLFASGIRPPALGRYLNEHAQVSLAAELHGFAGEVPAGPARGVTWIPYDDLTFPFHGMVTPLDPTTLPVPAPHPWAAVHLFVPQDVAAGNRVTFSDDERDWAGLPVMRLRHRPSPADGATIGAAREAVLRLSRLLGRPVEGEVPWVHPPGSSLHYQGTVRMGVSDDGTSVCDPVSQVWGVRGLYVAGNGVIPTRTACNPTLTSMALAVLGARDLCDRLGRPAVVGAASGAASAAVR